MKVLPMSSKKKKLRALVSILVVGGLGLSVGGCDDVVKDSMFRDWCGDQLCHWKTESGSIKKVPTWHEKDYGVELADATSTGPTIISQVTEDSPTCLEFTMMANVDPAAQVVLGLDFNHDGTVEHEEPVAATGFTVVKTQLTTPIGYQGIRFVITKRGAGRAVLAQMGVRSKKDCAAPPLELHDQRLGTPCSTSTSHQCASGICADTLCAECSIDTDCSAGEACKERTGLVALGKGFSRVLPKQCAPAGHTHTPGEPCLVGDDCVSGVCEGTYLETWGAGDDGGIVPCPNTFPAAGAGNCVISSARGGRCR